MRIVTALYNIRGDTTPSGIRRIEDYLELGRDTMLRLQVPMTLFTGTEELAEKIRALSTNPRLDIHVEPFEDSHFYGDLELIEQRLLEYPIHNRSVDKDTALYLILNHSKMHYLQRAMTLNPSDDYFLWMDLGVQHAAKATREEWDRVEKEWPEFMAQEKYREKIHQLCIHTVMKHPWTPWKDFFTSIYHHIGGGCIGGHREALGWYREAFWALWRKILHEECWVQLDEALFTILVEDHPDRFRLYYGDYDGMVTNFIESKRSWYLVFQTMERHLNGRRMSQVHEVLETLDPILPQFLQDPNTHHLHNYLKTKILSNHELDRLILQVPWNRWFMMDDFLCQQAPVSFLMQLSEQDPGNKATLLNYQEYLTEKEGILPIPGTTIPIGDTWDGFHASINHSSYSTSTTSKGIQVLVEIHSDVQKESKIFLYSILWCTLERFQAEAGKEKEGWEQRFVTQPWGSG